MIRIKVCGITNLPDALACVEAGVDALGFIFVENTPRFVTPERAAGIIRSLPPLITPVGVFWDHPAGHVKAVVEACGLRALQLHGDETPDEIAQYPVPVIKTVKLSSSGSRATTLAIAEPYRSGASALLLDSTARWSEGEPREPIEWTVARALVDHGWRVLLSAGLSPENVHRAVTTVRPYAVDVCSGVEAAPARKDPDKIWRFVAEARRA